MAAIPDWRMGGVTEAPVEDYLYSLLPPRDAVLAEMEGEAAQHDIPIVGPAVGRLFQQLAMISGTRTVFEMGSAIGYSTIWWARGVGEGGRVYYTDSDQKNCERAKRYCERAGVAPRVTFKQGDALELLSEEKQPFDVIFVDVDKDDYPRALRLAVPRLKKGGLLVTDNVLWSGKVAEKQPKDSNTKAIQEFNRLLYSSPDLFTTIIPLRDGVSIAVKK
jgi:predicted O-methyltransferase YrrM